MESIKHRIKAHLYDDALTKDDENDYVAHVNLENSECLGETLMNVWQQKIYHYYIYY